MRSKCCNWCRKFIYSMAGNKIHERTQLLTHESVLGRINSQAPLKETPRLATADCCVPPPAADKGAAPSVAFTTSSNVAPRQHVAEYKSGQQTVECGATPTPPVVAQREILRRRRLWRRAAAADREAAPPRIANCHRAQ